MTTDAVLGLLSCVRSCGENKWRARCPAHEDRSPSLSLKQADDCTLIYCYAGCTPEDICAELGIKVRDLYSTSQSRPDPLVSRRRLAVQGLEAWRQAELRRTAEALRDRDVIIRHIGEAVDNGVITEDEAMMCFCCEFRSYSCLEHKFDCLLRDEGTLDWWREARRTA